MKRIGLMILVLIALGALSGIMASSSMGLGMCVQVDEFNQFQGDWTTPSCFGTKAGGNYIRVNNFRTEVPGGQWCAEAEQANHGNRRLSTCVGPPEVGNFILVRRAPPVWHMNGTKLGQGSAGITGQSKGSLVLKSKAAGIEFTITCSESSSVGTIDGQGDTLQGQGKGTVKYSLCKIETNPKVEGCKVAEPINTNQLKAHLARASVQGTEQIVTLFEPSGSSQTTEKVFATIKIVTCGVLNGAFPVKGSVAAAVSPQETEGQEGSLFFPETPISPVKHEGQEVKPGLTLGGTEAIFTGYYSQKLQGGGKFGVFNN
jgi:hypothetical protein